MTFPIPEVYREVFTIDQWQAYCELSAKPFDGLNTSKTFHSIAAQRGLEQHNPEVKALARIAIDGDISAVCFWLKARGIPDPLLVFDLMSCVATAATSKAAHDRGRKRHAGKPTPDMLTEAIIEAFNAQRHTSKNAAAISIARKMGLSTVTVRTRLKGVKHSPKDTSSLMDWLADQIKKT